MGDTRQLLSLWCVAMAMLFVTISGCSSGRAVTGKTAAATEHRYCPLPDLTAPDIERKNSVFVHPGMVWISDSWESGPIVVTANALRKKGYADTVVVVADRNPELIYEQMLQDPGTQFVGLHYSLGGKADILEGSYDATRRASQKRGVQLRYHAVLIDPYGISSLGNGFDISRPEVGQLLFILSSDNSMLRGRASSLPENIVNSPYVNFVHAEDVGEAWGHFSILPSGRVVGTTQTTGQSGDSQLDLHKTMAVLRAFFALAQGPGAGLPLAVDTHCLVSLITARDPAVNAY